MEQAHEDKVLYENSASDKFPSEVHRKPAFTPSFWPNPFIRHPGGNESLVLDISLDGDDETNVSWTIEVSNGTVVDLVVLDTMRNPKQGVFSLHEPLLLSPDCIDCSVGIMHKLEISPHMFDVNFTVSVKAVNRLV